MLLPLESVTYKFREKFRETFIKKTCSSSDNDHMGCYNISKKDQIHKWMGYELISVSKITILCFWI